MNRFLLTFLLISIALPAAAGQLEYVSDDAVMWEVESEADVHTEAWFAEDEEDLASDDLVPEPVEGQAASQRSDPFAGSAYVVIRVDGIPVELKDVARDAWFAPYVRAIAEEGIVSGYRDSEGIPLGLFGPADAVTIEQLAKIAVQSSGLSGALCDRPLLNATATGRWSQDLIRCAEGAGWAVFSDGIVDVERPATRAEVVVTILQAFEQEFGSLGGDVFTDVNSTTLYGAAIEAAAAAGVVAGYTDANGNPSGLFGPTDAVNRAEVAKMVTLGMQLFGE